MRKLLFLLFTGLLLMSLMTTSVTGCNSDGELTIEDIREFADPIAESMLLASNTGDYVKYSAHFDDTMKAAVSEYAFSTTNTLTKAKIGDYVSKEFSSSATELSNIIVYYDATYSMTTEPVEVKIVFKPVEDDWYVVGMWITSPALQE
jgi:hypothetical protein